MIRILHSSDLHLGKPFGRFPEDVRGRLRQARAAAVGRLAALARETAADVIVLAGDTFDSETPSPGVIRQALNTMAADPGVLWVMLPGNHDSLSAAHLWRVLAQDRPPNLVLAMTPEGITLPQGAVLLPAPCTVRRPGRDLTQAMDQPTPDGMIRIGIAHGGVIDFGEARGEDGDPAVIPPDRADRSGLAYLALGDWHGQLCIGARQWYAGTPEADSFKHAGRAAALCVTIAGPGSVPEVQSLPTGTLDWMTSSLDLLPGEAVEDRLAAALPPLSRRAATLIRVIATGRMGLSEQGRLTAAIDRSAPDFLHLVSDLGGLRVTCDSADLDLIDRGGALRSAAERLAAEAADDGLSHADRAVAGAALQHLFVLAQTMAGESA